MKLATDNGTTVLIVTTHSPSMELPQSYTYKIGTVSDPVSRPIKKFVTEKIIIRYSICGLIKSRSVQNTGKGSSYNLLIGCRYHYVKVPYSM